MGRTNHVAIGIDLYNIFNQHLDDLSKMVPTHVGDISRIFREVNVFLPGRLITKADTNSSRSA